MKLNYTSSEAEIMISTVLSISRVVHVVYRCISAVVYINIKSSIHLVRLGCYTGTSGKDINHTGIRYFFKKKDKDVMDGISITQRNCHNLPYLLTTRRFNPMKTKKFCYKGVIISAHMTMIVWEHPQQNLQVRSLVIIDLAAEYQYAEI